MTTLQVMALLGPVFILFVAMVIVVLTRWQDQHEARRRAAKAAAPHQP